jgi:hypothetical protein
MKNNNVEEYLQEEVEDVQQQQQNLDTEESEENVILAANLKRLWHLKARADRFSTVDPRKTGQMISIDKLLAQSPLRVSEGFCDFAPLPFKETEMDYRQNMERFLRENYYDSDTPSSKADEWAQENIPLHFSQNNWDPIFNLKSYEGGNHIVFPSSSNGGGGGGNDQHTHHQHQHPRQHHSHSALFEDTSSDTPDTGDDGTEIYKSYVDMKSSLGENLAMDLNKSNEEDTTFSNTAYSSMAEISSNLLNDILSEPESEEFAAGELLWNQLKSSIGCNYEDMSSDDAKTTSPYLDAEELYTTQLIQHFTV